MEIICAGFGGQGIIKMGYIIGQAAAIFEGKESVQTQSYGPEARGGACHTGVIISKDKIDYPRVQNADVLVVMSQPAFDTFSWQLKEKGRLIYDQELVEVKENPKDWKLYPIPALKIANEPGRIYSSKGCFFAVIISLPPLLSFPGFLPAYGWFRRDGK